MRDLGADPARVAEQEQRLRFERFHGGTARDIGLRPKAAAVARGASLVIDISLHGQQLFYFAMPGTTPDNADWIWRKRNPVARLHRSSFAVGLSLQRQETTLEAKTGVSLADFATHGGGFLILLIGTGCAGTIMVSGLPKREDHELIVAVLEEHLG